MYNRIIKNTSAIVFSNIAVKIIALILSVILARYLGVELYGKYSFVTTYLVFFAFIGSFGIDPVIIRDIARNASETKRIMSNALIIRFFTSFFAIFLSILIISKLNYPEDTKYYISIMSITLLFQSISYLLESLFQTKLVMQYSAYALIVSKIINGIFIFGAVYFHRSLTDIFIIMIISEFIRLIIVGYFSQKYIKFTIIFDGNYTKYLLKEALPFIVSYGLYVVYYRVDILMLSYYFGEKMVGYYSAGYKLVDPLIFLPTALSSSLLPILSKEYIENKNKMAKIYSYGSNYIMILMFPMTIGIFILAQKLITMFYGTEYSGSIIVLQILIFTLILNSLNAIQNSLLIASSSQKYNTYSIAICAILNVLLNIILIPKYNYIGASIATLISVFILFSAQLMFIYTKLDILPLKGTQLLKPVASSIIMAIIVYSLINSNILFQVMVGVVVYITTMLLIKGIKREDIDFFKKYH